MGEKRSIYVSRKDFHTYGYTDGCTGCRDIASGKKRVGSSISPKNVARRKRMETAIKTADPDRWARHLLRRGQEDVAEEEEDAAGRPSQPAVLPALEDGDATPQGDDEDDEHGWGLCAAHAFGLVVNCLPTGRGLPCSATPL